MLWIHTPRLRGQYSWKCFRYESTDCVSSVNAGLELYDDAEDNDKRMNGTVDASDHIVDIREYDVPYHVRVAIDKG